MFTRTDNCPDCNASGIRTIDLNADHPDADCAYMQPNLISVFCHCLQPGLPEPVETDAEGDTNTEAGQTRQFTPRPQRPMRRPRQPAP